MFTTGAKTILNPRDLGGRNTISRSEHRVCVSGHSDFRCLFRRKSSLRLVFRRWKPVERGVLRYPVNAVYNQTYVLKANSVNLGDRSHSFLRLVPSMDVGDLFRGELGRSVVGTTPVRSPVFSPTITNVVFRRTQEKMFRVTTGRVVTGVAYHHTVWDRSFKDSVGQSVCSYRPTADARPDHAIAIRIASCCVLPTTAFCSVKSTHHALKGCHVNLSVPVTPSRRSVKEELCLVFV